MSRATKPGSHDGGTESVRYRDALNAALRQEMERDESIVLIGEDIGPFGGAYKVTRGLLDHFGSHRVQETPISEAAIVGLALGAALGGLRPCAEIMYIDMATIAMDQIVNHLAKWRYMHGGQVDVPVVIRTQQGAGTQAGPQHSQSLEAWFAHVPGLAVVQPADAPDAAGLLTTALRSRDPVMFIEHKRLYTASAELRRPIEPIPFGRARIVRQGKDLTLVATAAMVQLAEDAAEKLARKDDVSAEVIDPRTLRPLDIGSIARSVKRTGRLVIVHEANGIGGFGGEIAYQVQERLFGDLKAPIRRVTALDSPIPANPKLEAAVLPSVKRIVETAHEVLR